MTGVAQKLLNFSSKLDQFVFDEKSDLNRDGATQLLNEARALSKNNIANVEKFMCTTLDNLAKQILE